MSDETTNPQPSDPPVGGSGGGNAPAPTNPEDLEEAQAQQMSEPPTGGSGSGT